MLTEFAHSFCSGSLSFCSIDAHVVGVADGDIAFAGIDALDLQPVVAGGLARQIGFHALQPGLGPRLAMRRDHRGDQRDVVDVLAGADADLAAPFRVGEFFVGDRVLLDALLRGVDHARAAGEPDPLSVGRAIGGRDRGVERRRLDRLGDAGIGRLREIADIDREQEVGRAVAALGLNALDQALLGIDHIDLDAGLVGELFQQRVDQIRLPVGVDIDLSRLCGRGQRCDQEGNNKRKRGGVRTAESHRHPPMAEVQGPGIGRFAPKPSAGDHRSIRA